MQNYFGLLVYETLLYYRFRKELTLMGTEAIFAIFIEVVSGRAPQEAIVTALRCAAVVLRAHEQEGELTELSISVAIFHLHHCWKDHTVICPKSDFWYSI